MRLREGSSFRRPGFSAGDSLPMDVSSVHHKGALLRYSVSLLGYGFYGDIIKDSEKQRWMGLIRYDFSGNAGWRAGPSTQRGDLVCAAPSGGCRLQTPGARRTARGHRLAACMNGGHVQATRKWPPAWLSARAATCRKVA